MLSLAMSHGGALGTCGALKSMTRQLFAQGDVLLEKVADENITTEKWRTVAPDKDGGIVLQRGEEHGHRHAIHGGGAKLVQQPNWTGGAIPDGLYVGHLVVETASVRLVHEEHAPIELSQGTYLVRRQRQYSSATEQRQRIVAD